MHSILVIRCYHQINCFHLLVSQVLNEVAQKVLTDPLVSHIGGDKEIINKGRIPIHINEDEAH